MKLSSGWTSRLLLVLLSALVTFFPSSTALAAPPQFVDSPDMAMKDERITLPNGIQAQVLSCIPKQKTDKPPIIFLHGSFHGAWCWQENYMPYFAKNGFPCAAFSWRGTGGTPAGEGIKKMKILEHCEDLQGLLDSIPSILGQEYQGRRPILVAHSIGGIYVMKYLEQLYQRESGKKPIELFSGIASLCSVPPSGNGKSTLRLMRRSLRDAYQITVGFVLKKVNTDVSICRQCFFGGEAKVDGTIDDFGVSDDDIVRYQGYFARDSKIVLDVSDLSRRLPSKHVDDNGRAPFVTYLPPCLVVGAKDDFIVDEVANMETAKYYGVDCPVYVDSPHDIMLTRKWQNGALVLKEWIENKVLGK
jgi:pimeloyl-ACP methyl ester carboxylesterase